MSEFIKAQREVRANLISQVREIIDDAEKDSRGLKGEELAKVNAIEADIAKADEAISVAQRAEDRKVETAEAARGFEPSERLETGDIFRALSRGDIRSHTFQPTAETRATLTSATDTVPVDFLGEVFMKARATGPMLELADVIQRESGQDLRIPRMTAYSTAAVVAEGGSISDSEPTFGSLLLTPFKTSFIVKVSNELIDDAGFSIESVIQEQAGNAIGFTVNDLCTTGDGSSKPEGIVPQTQLGVTAASATAITADELIDLAYSVDSAVRRMNPVFMADGTTVAAIRKLKDTAGNYIYDPQTMGGPDRLLGYPIVENAAMDAIATGKKTVLFGAMDQYKIVTTGLQVATSTDAFFSTDETAYRFVYRFDGKLTDGSHVKHLIQA